MQLRQLPQFEYFVPKELQEACSFLHRHADEAAVMAGGTDLLLHLRQRKRAVRFVVSLKNLTDLRGLSCREGEGLRIGPLVTHQAVVDAPFVRERYKGLWTACSKVGTPQVRNMGTVGGNLCNAAPSADSAPPLIASGATVKIAGVNGEKSLPLEEFFIGPGKTVLGAGELLREIDVPLPPARSGLAYVKLPARTAVDIAAVGVAAFIALDETQETCCEVRIVLGAVAPTPLRAGKAEEALRGRRPSGPSIEQAAQLASEEARPISDVRGSASYRSEMVGVLTRQAIQEALAQARHR